MLHCKQVLYHLSHKGSPKLKAKVDKIPMMKATFTTTRLLRCPYQRSVLPLKLWIPSLLGLATSDSPSLSTGTLPVVYRHTLDLPPVNKHKTECKQTKPFLNPKCLSVTAHPRIQALTFVKSNNIFHADVMPELFLLS